MKDLYYQRHGTAVKARIKIRYRANPARFLYTAAKKRAKFFGLDFDLVLDDIQVPSHCPVLGIPIEVGVGKRTWNSPSVDRIDNSKGYVRGNVIVMSWRANKLKTDGTLEEFQALIRFLEKFKFEK